MAVTAGVATPTGSDSGNRRQFSIPVTVTDLRLTGTGWTATSSITAFVGTSTGVVLPAENVYSSNTTKCSHAVQKVTVTTVPVVIHASTGPCTASWTVHLDVRIPDAGLIADSYTAVLTHDIAINGLGT
ncbi:MAG: hypothetical protein LLG14_25365 [Nocardiaceae bacterium]|nr:hypothetical protein [Nocardiaceae bacterium]